MFRLIELLFVPPPMPNVDLPFMPARMEAAVRNGLLQVFQLAYYRGAWDGFVAGVLIALLFLPKLREQASKGANNVVTTL